MALLMGIDTGGTYTDCVLLDEDEGVVASAKALTTRHDLALGIGAAVKNVLAETSVPPEDVALVSLSTTLATNAVVEGQGGRVCLVLIGFDDRALSRAGLSEALRDDPHIIVSGGHDAFGGALAELDLDGLRVALSALDGEVSAFAVAGQFAVRNQDHERAARDLIIEMTGKPVTCSHELSQKLDGPRRALTCVLNARLINLIHHLITAAEELLLDLGIDAPLMVVRGDGALISAKLAQIKPIETILSGPAASLVGASWLSGTSDALVSDIGGTTTDYAFLRNGRPRLDPQGAQVGGWHTMVEAVAMRTIGLGGDSAVHVAADGLKSTLHLGPKRHIPLSLLAVTHPAIVHKTLERQLKAARRGDHDGLFARALNRASAHDSALNEIEKTLLEKIGNDVVALADMFSQRDRISTLSRLVDRGLVQIAGITPSDAAHVLGLHSEWDTIAAAKGMELFATKKTNAGKHIAESAQAMAHWIVSTLTTLSAEALLAAGFSEDGIGGGDVHKFLLAQTISAKPDRTVKFALNLSVPVIGLGASAHVYYNDVAAMLGTNAIIPGHAAVANAVGAVAGQVRVSVEAHITKPDEGCYQVFMGHVPGAPKQFSDLASALDYARGELARAAREGAREAGAGDVELKEKQIDKTATIEGHETLIESVLNITASGRPRITRTENS
jgi:N-methylhydantoinase A/oxoprolinase/acetone carboxylase beta subunit